MPIDRYHRDNTLVIVVKTKLFDRSFIEAVCKNESKQAPQGLFNPIITGTYSRVPLGSIEFGGHDLNE